MEQNGNIECAEKLLLPARIVLKAGKQIRDDPLEYRIGLWNEIRMNQARFIREECGTFLAEVDLHMRSQYDAALVALASAFIDKQEDFPQVSRYSETEIRIWQQIERYNSMEIFSPEEIRNRILKRDTDLFALFRDYYIRMNRSVEKTIDNPDIRLTLRYYLKRRWNRYRGKMDIAIADAVTKFNWFGTMVSEWDRDRNDESEEDDDPPGKRC
jgi:hypothetical protein